jgi:hypothetical protein
MDSPSSSEWSEGRKWFQGISKAGRRMTERRGGKDPENTLKLAEGALAFWIKRKGPDSREATGARADVAEWLERLEWWTEARVLREKVLASCTENWGADDPRTLIPEEWLAQNLAWSGMLEEANQASLRHVLECRRQILGGSADDNTLRVEARLAEINRYLGLDE